MSAELKGCVSTGQWVELTSDRNGNLTSDGEKHTYTFNPFGQLVRINDYAGGALIARFTYNGLGQRISEQTDVNNAANTGEPDGKVNSNDPVFYVAVDPAGRRVATFRHEDKFPKETFVWTLAGISGPGGGGGVANGTLILRDRNERAAIPTDWPIVEAADTRPERHYSVSDHTGSVVALLGLHTVSDAPTAKLAEQYRYSVTGVPYGIPLGDVDASGGVEDIGGGTSLDKAIVSDLETQSIYQVRGDLNLDGLVNSDDVAIVDAALGRSTGRGSFSIITLRNRVGLGQLERTLRVGPGWSVGAAGGGVYREDVGRTLACGFAARCIRWTPAQSVAPVGPPASPVPWRNPDNWRWSPIPVTPQLPQPFDPAINPFEDRPWFTPPGDEPDEYHPDPIITPPLNPRHDPLNTPPLGVPDGRPFAPERSPSSPEPSIPTMPGFKFPPFEPVAPVGPFNPRGWHCFPCRFTGKIICYPAQPGDPEYDPMFPWMHQ